MLDNNSNVGIEQRVVHEVNHRNDRDGWRNDSIAYCKGCDMNVSCNNQG